MRTTVRLNDHILGQAKIQAARSDSTLTRLIEEALQERLARTRRSSRPKKIRLITDTGKGLLPGINLDNMASLRDTMDMGHDPT